MQRMNLTNRVIANVQDLLMALLVFRGRYWFFGGVISFLGALSVFLGRYSFSGGVICFGGILKCISCEQWYCGMILNDTRAGCMRSRRSCLCKGRRFFEFIFKQERRLL